MKLIGRKVTDSEEKNFSFNNSFFAKRLFLIWHKTFVVLENVRSFFSTVLMERGRVEVAFYPVNVFTMLML